MKTILNIAAAIWFLTLIVILSLSAGCSHRRGKSIHSIDVDIYEEARNNEEGRWK